MASEFIGLTVLVTLKLPSNAQVQGLVADVVGQQLTLRDVIFPQTGHRLPEYRVEGSHIADLEITPHLTGPTTQNPAVPIPPPVSHGTHPRHASAGHQSGLRPPQPAVKQPFVDPAILSVGRQPATSAETAPTISPAVAGQYSTVASMTPLNTAEPQNGTIDIAALSGLTFDGVDSRLTSAIAATLSMTEDAPLAQSQKATKRSRRGARGRIQREAAAEPQAVELEGNGGPFQLSEEPESLLKPITGAVGGLIGKKAVKALGRKERTRRAAIEETDGWATGDAADVQGLPEFDFQENLLKFDKRSVFEEIRNGDTTADEDRLVSFNRLSQARPGTAGGKNLHATEMVLERSRTNGTNDWKSEAGETESDTTEAFESGRSSRRTMSRASTRLPSRKGSAVGSASHTLQHPYTTPRPGKSTHSPSPLAGSTPSSKPSLRMIATSELGLTEEILTENAARGIAQVGLSVLNPGGHRLGKQNHNALPVVVVLAGNNKSGARAVAGGRHLRNHGVRVMICLLGFEREEEQLENTRRQLSMFRNIGGKVSRWEDLQADLKALDSPPELIIDGLLGMHMAFEDLRTDDQAVAFDLIKWANKSKAPVMAVDVPSGIDGSTGEISSFDSQILYIRPKFIVSMGVPKTGVLNALISGEGHDWQLSVADIGISNTAWRKYGTRRRHGVEFASEWVVALRYQGGVQ